MTALESENLPFRPFEGFRTPERQDWLYQQGRSRPGAIVTKARAWESYHQYGLAVDMVLHIDGAWSWDVAGSRLAQWNRMISLAQAQGLEPLTWELPHLQLAGLRLADLRAGAVPEGGDSSWWDAIHTAVREWAGEPANPAFPPPRGPVGPSRSTRARPAGRTPSRRRSRR
jgi:peptidoglycan L-alanyl-D-glutamate endopeptidase CwlK